jgi:hypothetical protein
MRTILLGLSLLAVARVAHADQCQVLDADQATAAVKLLTNATILAYCEPCGDAPPATVPGPKAHSVQTHLGSSKHELTVAVDGKEIDLAYTYIQTGKSTITNVARMVGCPATGVTGFVTIGVTVPDDDRLAKLADEQRALGERITRAVDAVANAQSDSDRSAAKAQLTALQREKADLDKRVAAARADAAKAARDKGVKIRKECLDNPLAKGC